MFLWTILAFFTNVLVTSLSQDTCDWFGSGEAPSNGEGVQPVDLRCAQGRILWNWPKGALHLVLHFGSTGKDFQGCLRTNNDGKVPARIYVEGQRSLILLLSPEDKRPIRLHRCFNSFNGRVALYVEADAMPMRFRKTVLDFSYQLQARAVGKTDTAEECRPCSDQELLQFYCTSDFVLHSSVTSLIHNRTMQMTEMKLRVWNFIRPVFYHKEELVVYAPLHCQIASDDGEYVIFANYFLNLPTVQCAPRFQYWKKLRHRAMRLRINQCSF